VLRPAFPAFVSRKSEFARVTSSDAWKATPRPGVVIAEGATREEATGRAIAAVALLEIETSASQAA
jgi:hypothetical protein